MTIAKILRTANIPCFPCRADKKPAVARGEDWRDVARLPGEQLQWLSGVVGVPIPPGVLVIDLDTYKGVTRETVEAVTGPLPWDAALIQYSMHGGHHYAFNVPTDEEYPNGSNVRGTKGLDLRAAGRGYIACGAGYSQQGAGVLRLASPELLPALPDSAREALRVPDRQMAPGTAPQAEEATLEKAREALAHIPPGITRDKWIRVAMALHGIDSGPDGLALFDQWSFGGLDPEIETPDNYVAEDIETQWRSFQQRENGINPATLFYTAIEYGWKPPRGFSLASIFQEAGRPIEEYQDAVRRMREQGGDPAAFPVLLRELETGGFDTLQREMLLAVLQSELKEAGLLTKDIKSKLDGQKPPPARSGAYGKNDTENALLFLERCCTNGQDLIRHAQDFWVWTGTHWKVADDAEIAAKLCHDMSAALPSNGQIEGALGVLKKMVEAPNPPGQAQSEIVVFRNTCLHAYTGVTMPHSRSMGATYCLPYDYDPEATCPAWIDFLRDVFENDEERAMLLQEWFGYMLVMSYDFHKILLMIGPPRAGKGTIIRALNLLIGPENFAGGSLDGLAEDYTLEMIQNKSVMAVGDAPRRLNQRTIDRVVERLKSISGGDSVPFNRKWKSGRNRILPTRFMIGANDYPSMFDESGALAGRIMPLPFNVSFANREDPRLIDRISAELPGVAIWALHGLQRLKARGRFIVPEASRQEIEDLHDAYSPLRVFMRDCCKQGSDHDIAFTDQIHRRYIEWCAAHGEPMKMTKRTFELALKTRLRGTAARPGQYTNPEGKRQRGYKYLICT